METDVGGGCGSTPELRDCGAGAQLIVINGRRIRRTIEGTILELATSPAAYRGARRLRRLGRRRVVRALLRIDGGRARRERGRGLVRRERLLLELYARLGGAHPDLAVVAHRL